jgi:SAM-dependent methyltransferase
VKQQIPISKAVKLYGQEEISKLVDLRVAEDDTMINQDGDPNFHLPHYLSVGANALAIIKTVMKAAGRDSVDSILDYACGHGRVMRWFVAAFPRTKIYGADANQKSVISAREMFGVEVTKINPPALPTFNKKFDLIWIGSLFTHLEEPITQGILQLLSDSLNPNGILVASMQCQAAESDVKSGKRHYKLDEDQRQRILDSMAKTGFGYGHYPNRPNYGIAICHSSKLLDMVEATGLRPIFYQSRAWDNHQDVFAGLKA